MTVSSDGNVICLPTEDVSLYNITDKCVLLACAEAALHTSNELLTLCNRFRHCLVLLRYQAFDLQDPENALINSAIMERSLLDQVISTVDSLVPQNFTQVIPNTLPPTPLVVLCWACQCLYCCMLLCHDRSDPSTPNIYDMCEITPLFKLSFHRASRPRTLSALLLSPLSSEWLWYISDKTWTRQGIVLGLLLLSRWRYAEMANAPIPPVKRTMTVMILAAGNDLMIRMVPSKCAGANPKS